MSSMCRACVVVYIAYIRHSWYVDSHRPYMGCIPSPVRRCGCIPAGARLASSQDHADIDLMSSRSSRLRLLDSTISTIPVISDISGLVVSHVVLRGYLRSTLDVVLAQVVRRRFPM